MQFHKKFKRIRIQFGKFNDEYNALLKIQILEREDFDILIIFLIKIGKFVFEIWINE